MLQVAEAADVVEGEVVAVERARRSASTVALVERRRLAHLDDHALGGHRLVQAVDDQAGARIHQPEAVADDVLHAPLQEHSLHHRARGSVGIVERRRLVGAAAVEQLVPEDLTFRVDDLLSSEEHLWGHAAAASRRFSAVPGRTASRCHRSEHRTTQVLSELISHRAWSARQATQDGQPGEPARMVGQRVRWDGRLRPSLRTAWRPSGSE